MQKKTVFLKGRNKTNGSYVGFFMFLFFENFLNIYVISFKKKRVKNSLRER